MTATSSESLVGQTLGGARLDRLLAKGLLADVYLGMHTNLNAQVAVKVLSPKVASQGMSAERFMREGRALAKLVHPNIVKIHNVGVEAGKYFIVMDFVQDGANLRALAKKQFLKPYQSLIVTRRLAEALDYIHAQGLIHRDIKPANICLRQNGQPILMDFSLIKDESSDIQLTAPGTIMGTVNFMPPEQAQPGGPFGKVTSGSDVYSLGATFYWLLTGRAPFKGRTPMETIIKLIRDPVVPPSQLNPSVPTEIDDLCLLCLAKDPAKRYKTAAELIQAIDDAVSKKRSELQNASAPTVDAEDSGRAPKPAAEKPAPPAQPAAWGKSSGASGEAPASAAEAPPVPAAPVSPPVAEKPSAPPPKPEKLKSTPTPVADEEDEEEEKAPEEIKKIHRPVGGSSRPRPNMNKGNEGDVGAVISQLPPWMLYGVLAAFGLLVVLVAILLFVVLTMNK